MNEKEISISAGNSKMGAIPSVSLPAWTTCPKNAPCFRECYAAKISRLRPSVRMAYERNLAILQSDPDLYFSQVEMQARISSFFRWHAEDQDGFDIFAETETDEKEDIADAFDVSPEEIAVYRVRGWQPVFAEV